MMMRVVRLAFALIFTVTSVLFGVVYIKEKRSKDYTIPEIKISEEVLEVGLKSTYQDYLKGVTAYDAKDGDLTDRVVVESVSKFITKGVCKVTYAVCDKDNNVANATRKIKFKNYTSPQFRLSGSLCYSLYEPINLFEYISAVDCIDGLITGNIIITSDDFAGSSTGVFTIDATVTNSKGDTSKISLPLIVEDRSVSAPKIELSEYMIYADLNEQKDFKSYLVSAKDSKDTDLTQSVRIETNIDMTKEGLYSVHYYVTDSYGSQGHTVLMVYVGK